MNPSRDIRGTARMHTGKAHGNEFMAANGEHWP
jgi:hypothetical protein